MITEHEIEADVDDFGAKWLDEILRAVQAGDVGAVEAALRYTDFLPYDGRVVGMRDLRGDAQGPWLCLSVEIEHGPIYREKDIEIPAWVAHWRDDSWGNDTVAFTSLIAGDSALVLWVNYYRAADREDSGGNRFHLARLPVEAGEYDYNADGEELYDGNDPAECRKACAVAEGVLREAWLHGIAKTRRPTEEESALALAAYARAAEATR